MFERFESAKVRNLRLEHKREVCALRGEIEYYKAAQIETAHTAHFMAERMNKDAAETAKLRAEVKRLKQMLKIGDEARKGIAEKYNALREAYDELAADHEKLVYAVEHKEAEI
jgi:hypothetical protein